MKKVKINKKNRIFDDFFQIDEVYLSFKQFNGQMSPVVRRLCFERGDSTAALVYNRDTKKIYLVNQFRYPAYQKGPGWITEVVAGMIETDETPENSIRREIMEELGYHIEKLEHIATFYVSPGGTSERIILYCAQVVNAGKVQEGGGNLEENEDIQVVEFDVDQVEGILATGKIKDAKSIIALQWFQQQLVNGKLENS